MTVQIGFRCPELMAKQIEAYRKRSFLSKTDAIVSLLEIAFNSLENTSASSAAEQTEKLNVLTRLVVQQLAVINQLGDLAGEEVMDEAEKEYHDILKNIGISS